MNDVRVGRTSTLEVNDARHIRRGARLFIEGEHPLVVIAVRGTSVEVGRWRWWHTAEFRLRRFAARVWLELRLAAEMVGERYGRAAGRQR
jgi:hypothetical protein